MPQTSSSPARRPAPAPAPRRPRSRGRRVASLRRRPRERRAHAPGDRSGLVVGRHVEGRALDHRSVARQRHRLVSPEALRVSVAADHAGIHAQPVAGGDHDVSPNLDVLALLVEVALFAEDGPRAVLLEYSYGEVAEIRATLLLVHERLFRSQLPAHALRDLFEVDFLYLKVCRRRRRALRLD